MTFTQVPLLPRIDFAAGGNSYYDYDADSKRVSQRTAEGFRQFVYQGPDMLALQMERDESEETVAQYTMGAGLEAMHRDGDSSFYHYNHLGTALALTGANEAVTDTYRHDAWGVLLASTGSNLNPHTYVGRERYYRMPEAEMYHLGFRDYAQGLGRFMTVDPIGRFPNVVLNRLSKLGYLPILRSPIGASLSGRATQMEYGFVENRPAAMVDPAGLQPLRPGLANECDERYQRCISDQVSPIIDCVLPLLKDLAIPLPYDWKVFALCAVGCVPVGVGSGGIGYGKCLALCLGISDIISNILSIAPVWYFCNRELKEGRESCLFAYAHCCYRAETYCGEACDEPPGGWDDRGPGNPDWWKRRRR